MPYTDTLVVPPTDTIDDIHRWKKLESNVTGEEAPRPNGKDALVKINVLPESATFHCLQREHSRKHKGRKITFESDKACSLVFTKGTVFNPPVSVLPLEPNTPVELAIADPTSDVETSYYAVVDTTTERGADPHIVIP